MSGRQMTGTVYCSSVKFRIGEEKTRGPRAEDKEGQFRLKKSKKEKEVPETPPELVVKPRRQFIDFGQNAKFKASFDGSSNTTLSWSKDGVVLVADDHFKMYESDGYHYLEVCNVTIEDNGWYTCTVENPAGSDSASADMEVFEKPQLLSRSPMPVVPVWTQPLANLTVSIGDDNLELECSSKDVVTPSVKWLHNGREVFSGFHMRTQHEGQSTSLTIKKVQEKDAGEFKCVMNGANGVLETSCVLTVTPAEKREPPVFVKELHDMEVTDGDKLELVVEVKGTPPIQVFWFHNNEEVRQDNPDFLLASLGSVHTLTLPRATPPCAGQFVCEAYNEWGDTDTFCLIQVREVECPELPHFVTRPFTLSAHEDESVTFTCQVQGQPLPSVVWEKGGVEITSSHKHKTSQVGDTHRLTIYNVDDTDTGEYACHLHNSLGDATHVFCLYLDDGQVSTTSSKKDLATRDTLPYRVNDGDDKNIMTCSWRTDSSELSVSSRSSVKKYQRNSRHVEFGDRSSEDSSYQFHLPAKAKDTYTAKPINLDRYGNLISCGTPNTQDTNMANKDSQASARDCDDVSNESNDVVSNGLRSLQMERSFRNVVSRTSRKPDVPDVSSSARDKASGSQTHREFTYHRTPQKPVTSIGLRVLNKSLSTVGNDEARQAVATEEPPLRATRLWRNEKTPAYSPSSSLQFEQEDNLDTEPNEAKEGKNQTVNEATSESKISRVKDTAESGSVEQAPQQMETIYRAQMVYRQNQAPSTQFQRQDRSTMKPKEEINRSNFKDRDQPQQQSSSHLEEQSKRDSRDRIGGDRKSSLTTSGSVFTWDKASATTRKDVWHETKDSEATPPSDGNKDYASKTLPRSHQFGDRREKRNNSRLPLAGNLKSTESNKSKWPKNESQQSTPPSTSSPSSTPDSTPRDDFRSVKLRPAAKARDGKDFSNPRLNDIKSSKFMSKSTDNLFSQVKLKPVAKASPEGRDSATLSRATAGRIRLKSKSSDLGECSLDSNQNSDESVASSRVKHRYGAYDTGQPPPSWKRNDTSSANVRSNPVSDSRKERTELSINKHERDSGLANDRKGAYLPDTKSNDMGTVETQKSDLMEKIRRWKTSPDMYANDKSGDSTARRQSPAGQTTPPLNDSTSHLDRVPDWVKQKALNKRNSLQLETCKLSSSLKSQFEKGSEDSSDTKPDSFEPSTRNGEEKHVSSFLSQTHHNNDDDDYESSRICGFKSEKMADTASGDMTRSSYAEDRSRSYKYGRMKDMTSIRDIQSRSFIQKTPKDISIEKDMTSIKDTQSRSFIQKRQKDFSTEKDIKSTQGRHDQAKEAISGSHLKSRLDRYERVKDTNTAKQGMTSSVMESKSGAMDTSWINRKPRKNIEEIIRQKGTVKTDKGADKPEWAKVRSPREIKLGNLGVKPDGDRSEPSSFDFGSKGESKPDTIPAPNIDSRMWKSTSFMPVKSSSNTHSKGKVNLQKPSLETEAKSTHETSLSNSNSIVSTSAKNKFAHESQSSSTISKQSDPSSSLSSSSFSCVPSSVLVVSSNLTSNTSETFSSLPKQSTQTSSSSSSSLSTSSTRQTQQTYLSSKTVDSIPKKTDTVPQKHGTIPENDSVLPKKADALPRKVDTPSTKPPQRESSQQMSTNEQQPSLKSITVRPSWMKSKSLRHIPIYPIQDNELSPRFEPFRATMDDSSSTISTTSISSLASDTSNLTTDSGYGKSVGALEASGLSQDSFDERLSQSTIQESPDHDAASTTSLTPTPGDEVQGMANRQERAHRIDRESSSRNASCAGVSKQSSSYTRQSVIDKFSTSSKGSDFNDSISHLPKKDSGCGLDDNSKESSLRLKDKKTRYQIKEELKPNLQESDSSRSSQYDSVVIMHSNNKPKQTSANIPEESNDTSEAAPRTARSEFLRNRLAKATCMEKNREDNVLRSSLNDDDKKSSAARPSDLDLSTPKEPRIKSTDVSRVITKRKNVQSNGDHDDNYDDDDDDDDPEPSFSRNSTYRRSMEVKSSFSRNLDYRRSGNLKLETGGRWSKEERLKALIGGKSTGAKIEEVSSSAKEDESLSSDLTTSIQRRRRNMMDSRAAKSPDESKSVRGQGKTRDTTEKTVEVESFPSFVTPLSDVSVLYGCKADLQCRVRGKPAPDVHWLHDRNPLEVSKDYAIHFSKLTSAAQLTIAETFTDHIGTYTCVATNALGSVYTSCRVTIETSNKSEGLALEGPVSLPPRVASLIPRVATLTRRSTLTLTLTFVGEPSPAVKWTQGEKELANDERVKIVTQKGASVLSIAEVTAMDSGKISATVTSSIGSDQASANVCVEDVPGAPVGKPHVYDIAKESASLSWCGPASSGGSQITYYVIEAKHRRQTTWDVLVPQCKELSHHIFGLEPSTTYQFRVRAANKQGLGPPSEPSERVITTDTLRGSLTEESDGNSEVFTPSVEYRGRDELPFEPREVKVNTTDAFENLYDVGEILGKGKFGVVYRCTSKSNGSVWAAKVLKCRGKEKATIKQEIDIMNSLHHPKLLMLWDAFESARQMVLVMEYVGAGELFERVIGEDFVLTERDCVHFLRQICDGVSYMHASSILHLDLKPENILCISENSNRIKIIDFGLARVFKPGDSVKVMLGTPEFIAPEVINYDEIGFTTDMWSIGVICYVLLSGLSPFSGDNDMETLSNVTVGEFDFEDEAFDEISDAAKDFISKLLIKKKEKRLLTQDCLAHGWLGADEVDGARYKRLNTDRLRRFMVRRKWLKTGNAVKAVSRLMKSSILGNFGMSRSESTSSVDESPDTPTLKTTTLNNVNEDFETPSASTTIDSSSDSENKAVENRDVAKNQSFDSESNIPIDKNKNSCLSKDQNDNKVREHHSHVNSKNDANATTLNNSSPLKVSPSTPAQTTHTHTRSHSNGLNGSSQSSKHGAPIFSRKMADCKAFAGDAVRFDVIVTGDPAPEIVWYFEEDLINSDSKYSIEKNVIKGTNSLIVRSIEEDDDGEYFCKAHNSSGEVVCSAELSVLMI